MHHRLVPLDPAGYHQRTVAIAAGGSSLYQLHNDGSIWEYAGPPCTTVSCRWTRLDTNHKTVAIATAGSTSIRCRTTARSGIRRAALQHRVMPVEPARRESQNSRHRHGRRLLYQLHNDGSIWQYDGPPCAQGICQWKPLDRNNQTAAIAAGGERLYQLHADPIYQMHDNNRSGAIRRSAGSRSIAIRLRRLLQQEGKSSRRCTRTDRSGATPVFHATRPAHVAGGEAGRESSDGRNYRLGQRVGPASRRRIDLALHRNALRRLGRLSRLGEARRQPRDHRTRRLRQRDRAAAQRWMDLALHRYPVSGIGNVCRLGKTRRQSNYDRDRRRRNTARSIAWRRFDLEVHRRPLHESGDLPWLGEARRQSGDVDGRRRWQGDRPDAHRRIDWRYTGAPCNPGGACPGWEKLDANPATTAIAAAGKALVQLHSSGAVWRYTGVACDAVGACRGWEQVDNNARTKRIALGTVQP